MKFDSRVADSGGPPRRFSLGMAQMFAATTALVLLVNTGATAVTIGTAVFATMLTVTSRWLAHQRRDPRH